LTPTSSSWLDICDGRRAKWFAVLIVYDDRLSRPHHEARHDAHPSAHAAMNILADMAIKQAAIDRTTPPTSTGDLPIQGSGVVDLWACELG